jgi:imidazole glycerol-phosphate synthase subunit HisH
MSEVVIVDSGGANLASLQYAFERLGARVTITTDGAIIASAERVVLPGVGAAGHAMERLRAAGLTNVLRTLTQPVLGICLGLQLLAWHSNEGATRCLGVLSCAAYGIQPAPGRSVPHMGWNDLKRLVADPLLEGVSEGEFAYFAHSYALPITEHTLARCEYGGAFSAMMRRRNFWGTQFHPERSGKTGARVLENFLKL